MNIRSTAVAQQKLAQLPDSVSYEGSLRTVRPEFNPDHTRDFSGPCEVYIHAYHPCNGSVKLEAGFFRGERAKSHEVIVIGILQQKAEMSP